MVVAMTAVVHDLGAMPVGRAPAAPVGVRPVLVPYEPAALHLGDAKRLAATAGHLVRRHRQIHVFCRIAVLIVDAKSALAIGERPCGVGV